MRNFYALLFFVFLTTNFVVGKEGETIITNDLQTYLEQKNNEDLIRVNIRFKAQANLLNRYADLQKMNPEIRRQTVVDDLKTFSKGSQKGLISFLEQQKSSDYKIVYQLWITNVVTCYLTESLIEQLSLRNDIDRIDIDEDRQLISEKPEMVAFEPSEKGVDEITYNVTKVNADDVWALGYTGEGVIVSVLDVGVNYNHTDLTDHMWESDDYPNHGYDFVNNDNDPMDDHGHGTHCAGTVAGDGTAGSQTGMAPDATIMACKVLDAGGNGSESGVWAAAEFSVEQGAHVLSLSLGWQHAWNPDRVSWRNTFDNVLAAGVVAAIAAGNEGGNVNNVDDVRTPGDCPPPWLNPDQTLIGGISAVVCVGATDQSDDIAYFSSRGPSEWENIDPFNDYPHNPELGLIRPDVSAPGVDIKSCTHNSNTGYTLMSGTSMATPGVAGMMALLLSKNIGLTPADIAMILETTSVELGAEGKDNVFGSGRVDILAAIETTSEAGPAYQSHVLNDTNGNGEIEAGETVSMSLTMFNGSDFEYDNIDVTVSCESSSITMTDSEENYGSFTIGQSVEREDAFSFTVSDDLEGLEDIRFVVTATDGDELWESSFTVISYGPRLSLSVYEIDDTQGNQNGRLDPGEEADILVKILNEGQANSELINLNLSYESDYISFTNVEYVVETLESENEVMAVFSVVVSPDAPIGQNESFTINMVSGVYTDMKEYSLQIGLIVEDWESGSLDSFNWTFSGAEWLVTDEDPYEGNYCVKSAAIGDNSQTSLILECDVEADGFISFYKKVSSEATYDYLKFYIDGSLQDSWSGEVEWSKEEYEVSAGSHAFKWEYMKDSGVSNGSDAAWVDFIVMPPLSMPTIDVEVFVGICEDDHYTSDAVVDGYESLLWTTSGDGSFDDATIATTTYTPGTTDIENGGAELTITASNGGVNVSSTVSLGILGATLDAPEMPVGLNEICQNTASTIYTAEVGEYETLNWIIEPEEAGELVAEGNSVQVNWNITYTGDLELSAKLLNECAESDYSEALNIIIHETPGFNPMPLYIGCVGEEFLTTEELTGTAPWILSVEGIEDIIVTESPLTISFNVEKDSVILFNSITDAHLCTTDLDQTLTVEAHELPFVDLGMDSLICMNHTIVLDAGEDGIYYNWSTEEITQTIVVDSSGMNDEHEKLISVVVTDDYCANQDEVLISFKNCTGIGELTSVSYLNVYPNPNQGKFDIAFDSKKTQELQVRILNMLGEVVYQELISVTSGSSKHAVDISDLSAQTYLLLLSSDEGQTVKRIIIE